MTHKRLTLFAGHYGSGKTNIALNYARWLRRKGEAGAALPLSDPQEHCISRNSPNLAVEAVKYILIFIFRDPIKQLTAAHCRKNRFHLVPPCCCGNRQKRGKSL